MVLKSQPLVYLLPNNEIFTVLQSGQGLTLTELEIIITAPQVNGNIQFNRQSKPKDTFFIPINSDIVVTFYNADITQFEVEDSNNYNYYLKITYYYFDTQLEYNEYLEKFDFKLNINPIGNGIIQVGNTTSNPVPVNINEISSYRNPINISSFTQTLTTANTKQPLNSVIAYNFITIVNTSASDTIYIGDINNQNIPISVNSSFTINLHEAPINLNSIYWIGATANNDKIVVIYA